METNKHATELQSIQHRAYDIGIPEAYSRKKIYYDNHAAVQWASSVTSKGIKHLNLRENMVRECHQSKDVEVEHIPGIINPSAIFDKGNEGQHPLQKPQRLHDGLSSSVPEVQL